MTRARAKRVADSSRAVLGHASADASFPAAGPRRGLPDSYTRVLADIKRRISSERVRAVLAANSAMVLLYWDIGRMILARQDREGWGARVIDRLSVDLRESFPDMHGLSPRNLKYMRTFAFAWTDRAIVQRIVAQLPWRHNIALLERVANYQSRLWYAEHAIQNGWSQPVLCYQIENHALERHGKIIHNFKTALPPTDSDLAAQVFKDPYLFDFLGTADPRREREVEQALVDHIQRFLLELGTGFAFVGRQVQLEVGDQDFKIDLLFYHLKLRCYVVIELKAVPFEPAFVGQMNLYLSAADDLLRHADDKPAIGLLLCRSKHRVVVEYALRNLKRPIGVAHWETKIVKSLPKEFKSSLPTIEELEEELTRVDSEE
jgi:predicted nuclease of restriction endonuclease-like (RecB) superfamily